MTPIKHLLYTPHVQVAHATSLFHMLNYHQQPLHVTLLTARPPLSLSRVTCLSRCHCPLCLSRI